MLPSVFGENLFDEFFGDSFEKRFFGGNDPLYGKHAKNLMKTDVRETENQYELSVDLPGFKKDEIQVELNEGVLTITGNGTIDSSDSEAGGFGAVNNKGTLIVENGTYRGAKYASGSSLRNTGAGAVLTVKDGLFEEATCAIFNEGTVTINGGTFTGTTCSQCNSDTPETFITQLDTDTAAFYQ